jgi:magnesium chelatase subunit D
MQHFPFSAVVGSDDLALALTLTTVSPAVGGVLVRGEKGTAKSTMVRALASLLPPVQLVDGCRFRCDPATPDPGCPDGPHDPHTPALERPARLVELPVGATEDRVVGSLHLGKALSSGVTEYEPGLLAEAHRGLLYVDEVNLLHDHLVDVLLDAAAMGRATVEREGVSVTHAARFVLVGTMNPEEGELRPQLLDRFGLGVDVAAPRDPARRVEVVRRRLAFEADPARFAARYADAERQLAERIVKAQAVLPSVVLGDDALTKIAEVCAAFDVDGMRADLVTARTAVAHAAWAGRSHVTRADVRVAALLAIPHRRRRSPFDAPGLDEDLLDAILGEDPSPPDGPGDGGDGGDGGAPSSGAGDDPGPAGADEDAAGPGPDGGARPGPSSETDAPRSGAGDRPDTGPDGVTSEAESRTTRASGSAGGTGETPGGATPTSVAAAGAAYRPRLFTVAGAGQGEVGRRSRALTSRGRTIGSRAAAPGSSPAPAGLHLTATLRAAALRGLRDGDPHVRVPAGDRRRSPVAVTEGDLRLRVTEGRESNLVLLCVDASGSMAARRRMEQVKTAVVSLLLDAYQRRDKVGLVTFRGDTATVVVPPTGSVDLAAARLDDLPAGGRTPLAAGLARAADVLRVERLKDPRRRALLVVVTDGRANSGPEALARSLQVADHLHAGGVQSLVIDCETGRFRMGLAARLARHLGAEHVPVGEVSAEAITSNVRRSAA